LPHGGLTGGSSVIYNPVDNLFDEARPEGWLWRPSEKLSEVIVNSPQVQNLSATFPDGSCNWPGVLLAYNGWPLETFGRRLLY
jgi:hypothetical protein